MVQQIIVFLLGLYLLIEAIAAAALMHGGDKLCRIVKYLLTGMIGIFLMLNARHVDVLHIAMGLALALFLIPKTRDRIEQFIDQLREDGHA